MNTDFSISSLFYLWELKLPLKIKYFIWIVLHGKILTRANLFKRGWRGSVSCAFCSHSLETIFHLFLDCPRLQFFWNGFNRNNLFSISLSLKTVWDIWNYACSLSGYNRILILSLISTVLLGMVE
jgi:zinc-binding in reverse transcriptase